MCLKRLVANRSPRPRGCGACRPAPASAQQLAQPARPSRRAPARRRRRDRSDTARPSSRRGSPGRTAPACSVGKRLDLAQQRRGHAGRRAHQLVVEDVIAARPAAGVQRTRCTALAVDVLVVVVPGLGGPARVHRRVERPVRQVDAVDRVGERRASSGCSARATAGRTTRGSSSRACDSVTANGSSDSGRNASLTCSYGTSGDEPQNSQRWPTRVGIEDRDRLAALALDGDLRRLPAARRVGNAAQRRRRDRARRRPSRRRASAASPATRCRRTGRRAPASPDSSAPRRRTPGSELLARATSCGAADRPDRLRLGQRNVATSGTRRARLA